MAVTEMGLSKKPRLEKVFIRADSPRSKDARTGFPLDKIPVFGQEELEKQLN